MIRLTVCFALLLTAISSPASAHKDPELSGYIEVEGGRIWYRLNGAEHLGEKPAVIVIHGGPGAHHRVMMSLENLSDSFPVLLYDQLDSGNSDWPGDEANWKVERFVDEIDFIRDKLNLEEVILVGHSWGATIAAEYAARRPSGLKGVVLASPLISTDQWNQDNADWIKELPKKTQDALNRDISDRTQMDQDFLEAFSEFNRRHMCRADPCPRPDYVLGGPPFNDALYHYMWGPVDYRGTGSLADYDGSSQLSRIRVPTLMVCGEFDEARPRSCKKYAGMISSSETVIIKESGHATLFEKEEELLSTVRAFLLELD